MITNSYELDVTPGGIPQIIRVSQYDVGSRSLAFTLIARDGVLPRKAFSMGEADDKRFYLEARKIMK